MFSHNPNCGGDKVCFACCSRPRILTFLSAIEGLQYIYTDIWLFSSNCTIENEVKGNMSITAVKLQEKMRQRLKIRLSPVPTLWPPPLFFIGRITAPGTT